MPLEFYGKGPWMKTFPKMCPDQCCSQTSGDRCGISHGRAPGEMGTLPKNEDWSFFAHFVRRAPLGLWMGSLDSGMCP